MVHKAKVVRFFQERVLNCALKNQKPVTSDINDEEADAQNPIKMLVYNSIRCQGPGSPNAPTRVDLQMHQTFKCTRPPNAPDLQMHQTPKCTTFIAGNTEPAKKLKLALNFQPTTFFSQCIQPGIESPACKSMV